MDSWLADQEDCKPLCKYGRKCSKKNREHLEKYKHSPTKDDTRDEALEKFRREVSKALGRSSDDVDSGEISQDEYGKSKYVYFHLTNSTENFVQPLSIHTINCLQSDICKYIGIKNVSTTKYLGAIVNEKLKWHNHFQHAVNLIHKLNNADNTPCKYGCKCLENNEEEQSDEYMDPSAKEDNDNNGISYKRDAEGNIKSRDCKVEIDPVDAGIMALSPLSREEVFSWNSKICKLFLVDIMPDEFYSLWVFCKYLCPTRPEDAFLSVGLKLVGPFDVLAGHMKESKHKNLENGFLHWRYYYDPPELQTIIASTNSQFHIGYYRDNPLMSPAFLVSNNPEKNCVIRKLGRSLFVVLSNYLKKLDIPIALDLSKKLTLFENRGFVRSRRIKPMVRTFHRMGILFPYDLKTDHGYRPIFISQGNLKSVLKKYPIQSKTKLETLMNYANIACQESDIGTVLELGIDMFCVGNPNLHEMCEKLLVTAYNLLDRFQYGIIIQGHLKNRRFGLNMSIL